MTSASVPATRRVRASPLIPIGTSAAKPDTVGERHHVSCKRSRIDLRWRPFQSATALYRPGFAAEQPVGRKDDDIYRNRPRTRAEALENIQRRLAKRRAGLLMSQGETPLNLARPGQGNSADSGETPENGGAPGRHGSFPIFRNCTPLTPSGTVAKGPP